MASRSDLANAIRALAMDAVQAANSGHPGMPMGMADIAEVLWNDFLKHNPADPKWWNRDRFILSNGHGSMLQYALLHLSGYDLPMEELKRFRQLHSRTAGHPEAAETPGVETTTGPLGQGLANAVGMAIAEKNLAARYNRDGFTLFDHYTYVFVGDGCLMEGISHEAASLAGTLGLSKLIVIYDDNNISIDGEVDGWFTDDTPKRFEAYGWNVIRDVDGHQSGQIRQAIAAARENASGPTLICCKTIIGFGSPGKQGQESCHGAPLGAAEVQAARAQLNWHHPPFVIPDEIAAGWNAREQGAQVQSAWQQVFDSYKSAHPAAAAELERRMSARMPADWDQQRAAIIDSLAAESGSLASRKASQKVLERLVDQLPELVGGSADLAGSNLTLVKGSQPISAEQGDGNYLYFGVREFGMSAICNGLAAYGGYIPFAATFLVFSDYARNAIRMSALIPAPVIHVLTHDSIGLGEDGPTHQPIEHLASLRQIPNTQLWRPCDATETAVAWLHAVENRSGPTLLALSRQNLPAQPRDAATVSEIGRGGYVLQAEQGEHPDLILIATGSEVALAMAAAKALADEGRRVRVVSMPSTNLFDAQDRAYRERVLPDRCRARVAIEAGISDFWRKYVGLDGAVVGIDRFGASAPAADLNEYFGFTVEAVLKTCRSILN